MERIRCSFGLHNYVRTGKYWKKVTEDKGAAVIEKEVKYEKHKCLRCGKIKEKPYTYIDFFNHTKKKTRNKTTTWKDENSSDQ